MSLAPERPSPHPARLAAWLDIAQAVLLTGVAGLTVALVATLFAGLAFARALDEEGPGLHLRGDGIEGVLAAPEVASDVDIQVTGVVARVRLRQLFYNPSDGWVEGVYLFPLPERAAVDRLVMEAYEYTGAVMVRNMMTHDAGEGIDAFIEKRKPAWTGT